MVQDVWDFAARAIIGALGDVVTWEPGTMQEHEVKAVFGHGFERVQSGDVRVSSRRPEITVVASELPYPVRRGQRVRIRGGLFEVVVPKDDVEAVSVTCVLKKV